MSFRHGSSRAVVLLTSIAVVALSMPTGDALAFGRGGGGGGGMHIGGGLGGMHVGGGVGGFHMGGGPAAFHMGGGGPPIGGFHPGGGFRMGGGGLGPMHGFAAHGMGSRTFSRP